MSFAQPDYLYYLFILLPLIIVLWAFANYRRQKRLKIYSQLPISEVMGFKLNSFAIYFRLLLLILIGLLWILTLAQPQWGFEWVEQATPGSDIIIAFDVSESMLATDVSPSRLELARRKVWDLIAELRGDRVGIVAFAGVAFLHCPMTVDYGAIQTYLNHLRTDLIPIQGTAIAEALRVSEKALLAASNDGSTKAIILISDGEDHDEDALGVAKNLADKGIKLFTLGIGSKQGAPIPLPQGGFKSDQQGKMVMSQLNMDALTKLAEVGGGESVQAKVIGSELQGFYQNLLIEQLGIDKKKLLKRMESPQFKEGKIKKWYHRYQYFLLVLILLSMFEYLWMDYRRA